jgi:hypothetical protein
MRVSDVLLLMRAMMSLTMMEAGVEGDWGLELGEMCDCRIGATLLLLLVMMGTLPIG